MATIRGSRAVLASHPYTVQKHESSKKRQKINVMTIETAGPRLLSPRIAGLETRENRPVAAGRFATHLGEAGQAPGPSGWMENGNGRRAGSGYRRLWRWRFRSLRFLCLRIFLRRHLITLPTSGGS